MPIAHQLQLVCHLQQPGFAQVVADQLQAHGHGCGTKTGGQAQARQTGQRGRQGVDVGQIGGKRIGGFGTDGPGHAGGHRAGDEVAVGKGGLKILRDQAPDLLRLEVVGIVVAVAEHVGAQQDAALHLGPEGLAARALIHFQQIGVFGGAVAVAHTVVAAQVGAGLGRGDDVVGRNGQLGARQIDVEQGSTQPLALAQGGAHGGQHVGVAAGAKKFARQADAQPLQRLGGAGTGPGLAEQPGVVFGRVLQAGRVAVWVGPGHGREQQGAVEGAARHRAGLVEAGGVGHQPVARAAPVAGLDAGDAAKAGGLADRAAGVGAGGGRGQPGCYRHRRAAGGAAGHARHIPGVVRRAEGGLVVARAHGKFVAVELAQRHRAFGGQARHHGGVEGAAVALQHFGSGAGGEVARDQHVFVRQRHPQQRAALAGGQARIGGGGLRQRGFFVQRQVGP